ncbi:glycoside hydrolase family 29 protein [Mycena albidolilacea]|uniref:alpha-L-fucosidase n=1 Tax=Mycena albidolilacea TaxID=1033008 RepID=A0AAD7EZA6_9AGAR|nr:glycoside hydrolase family 29 protein [Mycena albidolilacea]
MRYSSAVILSCLPFVSVAVTASQYLSVSLALSSLFDNQAASADGSADFDAHGASFDSQYLPPGPWVYDGITYDFPKTWGEGNDNVVANGQVLRLDTPTYVHELHMVYSGDASGSAHEFVANFVLNFADNSTQQLQLYAKNWWRWPILNWGVIRTPYSFIANGAQKNFNASQIYQWSTAIPSEQPLTSITLPPLSTAHRLHLFAMAVSPSTSATSTSTAAPPLAIRRARFTTRWDTVRGARAQAVEVTLANMLPSAAFSSLTSTSTENTSAALAITTPHTIELIGPGLTTLSRGVVQRLVPGDQARVDVLVANTNANSAGGGTATVVVRDARGQVVLSSAGWAMAPLVESWTAEKEVLERHETPTWWNGAKFGIFIHWGVYSVPAWGPPKMYAEWYDWYLRNPANATGPTWEHHLDTYGPTVSYEDFIANFTASAFDAGKWVSLFEKAGAKYFVVVTKHHDGFSLFDTGNTTQRSSVHFGPKRDLVAELLDTAKKQAPGLHRGTYYSLPEWFNPDYAKYGFGQWPGGVARDAFNASLVQSYTGALPLGDYIDDLQLPHMLELATKYDTEIMWCDIGGPNRTLEFAAQFYNHAQLQGRQVTMNNRCGNVPDFETPEYATFGSIQPTSWESSEGMDPFSYGLNAVTNASQYKNATTIVQTLVDIVSKNGNFLLDIGPTAEGEIIEAMMEGLLDTGAWLDYSGSCIYDTNYWFPGSQDANPPPGAPAVRFLTTPTTFCIVAFAPPANGQLVINKRVPLLPGDSLRLLRPSGGVEVPWTVDAGTGQLVVSIPEGALADGRFAWALEATYAVESD